MRITPRWVIGLFMEGVFPLVFLATKELNRICVKNLQLVYGDLKNEREIKQTAKQYIKSIGYAMADLLYYVDRPDELSKIVHFEHEDHLIKALQSGKGVIAVSGHLGNFPLMFIALVQKGYKVNVVIRAMRDENFSKFMYRLCDKRGIHMIETSPGKQFLRESLGALKRNELLFILLDEFVAKENGVKVRFLNQEVMRATGPVLFFERTSSPVVPIFIAKDGQKHFKVFIQQPFEISKGQSAKENTIKNITGLTRIIEHFVSRYPLQWGGWLNKRWASGIDR